MQMIAFVVLRMRFKNAVRPYKSPTGSSAPSSPA